MRYVIIRGDGAFVAPSGSRSSYTFNILAARIFGSRESAQRECCGNETIVELDSYFAR